MKRLVTNPWLVKKKKAVTDGERRVLLHQRPSGGKDRIGRCGLDNGWLDVSLSAA